MSSSQFSTTQSRSRIGYSLLPNYRGRYKNRRQMSSLDVRPVCRAVPLPNTDLCLKSYCPLWRRQLGGGNPYVCPLPACFSVYTALQYRTERTRSFCTYTRTNTYTQKLVHTYRQPYIYKEILFGICLHVKYLSKNVDFLTVVKNCNFVYLYLNLSTTCAPCTRRNLYSIAEKSL
jgi:hypothetical protein